MDETRRRRYFVTIFTPDGRRMREIGVLDLDLFGGGSDESGSWVDGLITLEDVGRLVEAGYRVLVGDTDRPKRVHPFVDFGEWRSGLLTDLEQADEEA
jgi:hypothetical protein